MDKNNINLYKMNIVKAKKYLGQHFLNDLDIASRISDTVDDYRHLPVLEIGPGMGVLTQFLMKKDLALKVIEIDEESVVYLREKYPSLNILQDDFLKISIDKINPEKKDFCIIGNYPYNISSQIFFKILEWKDYIPCVSGMLQKEVAERIASPAGKKSYGILSVLLQTWYDIEYLFTVPPEVFTPVPKVYSGVIRLVRNGRKELGCDENNFKQIVKTAFNQRRKVLRNSLQPMFGKNSEFYQMDIFSLRPEQLSVDKFIELTKLYESIL